MSRKGVYPYSYFDGFERFSEKKLPPKEEFFNKLTDTHITDDDYNHALHVFDSMEMENLKDYHDFYLTTAVLLLADVFETFRAMCLRNYKLDPCHFYTAPGLAWEAALKMTNIELELLTDPDMFLFIEDGFAGVYRQYLIVMQKLTIATLRTLTMLNLRRISFTGMRIISMVGQCQTFFLQVDFSG